MYRSLNTYLRSRFGCKVYKLSLSTGCTCPNRDGTLGTRGCIFCNGSGDFAASSTLGIKEQIEQAKYLVADKAKNAKYIAYFQDYTNTYGATERLEPMFLEAISEPDIVALSIATRPDCLGSEILEMLARLREIRPVWVELGLQTIHEESARYIRRGYPLSVYDEAVSNLHAIGCEVVTHMILGLPGET
ncbi:MAG: TIGR01212 family radical SAM protein, partial [Clostridia bacterium]|nr:TIGR01212 family radical SAM protein [Clostridia bacterium]